MSKILHILDRLAGDGPTRSLLALAKYQAELGLPYTHCVVTLQRDAYPLALILAKQAGMRLVRAPDDERMRSEIENADIVQLHFWNNPRLYNVLYRSWPASRWLIWCKVMGEIAPQVIIPELAAFADMLVASTPRTLQLPVLQEAAQQGRTAMVYSISDFDRLNGVRAQPHEGFVVGYIGTVNPGKMHPNFAQMSAAIDLPGICFVVCGGQDEWLRQQVTALGAQERFQFLGYVENIKPVLERMDVFGYPLHGETSASSEKSLQEAMMAGVPPVVFPYGGVRHLVEHGQTGLIVHSESEYQMAIRFLYENPQERLRLGRNAREFAQANFDSRNAVRQFDRLYRMMMAQPKRERTWPGVGLAAPPSHRFASTLGQIGSYFVASLQGEGAADEKIASLSTFLATYEGGLFQYRNCYPDDPYLHFWSGLVLQRQGRSADAEREFAAAVACGLERSRVAQYAHLAS